MTTQIEAERLADEISNKLSWVTNFKAAAELRRLVSFNKDLMDEVERLQAELRRLVSFNQQLMDEVARLNQAVADERETCAKIADRFTIPMCDSSADEIALLIRARGNT